MSTTATREACFHSSLANSGQSQEAVQCPDCFGLYRNGKRLTSVSRIVGMFPSEPCTSCNWPIWSAHAGGCPVGAAIFNAQRRGKEVDSLFSAWINRRLDRIPVGIGEDSKALFDKLAKWFNEERDFEKFESQVLVADEECGGVLDLLLDGAIYDVKCTYDVSPTAAIQVGGYISLSVFMNRQWPRAAGIIHVTERYPKPRIIPVDMEESVKQFAICRDMYRMVQRVSK